MKPRTVLTLLILVVGLIAFIELYESKLPSSEERAAIARRMLGATEPANIEAIQIDWQGQTVRLERLPGSTEEDPEWWMRQPLEARADTGQVLALLDALAGLEIQRRLDDLGRAESGLEPPRLIATLTSTGDQQRIEIGREVPAGDSMIVAVDGEILVVGDTIWSELARELDDWRSRQVIDWTEDRIVGVRLGHAGRELELERRGEGFWVIEPFEDRADAEKVGALLSEIASMQIADFLDDPDLPTGDLGLDPALGFIELRAAEEEPFKMLWGRSDPAAEDRHYASAEGRYFTTSAELQPLLDAADESWRSRRLVSLQTYDIDRLEVRQPGEEEMTVERAGADWRRGDETISFTTVSELLYALTEVEGESFVPGESWGSLQSGTAEPLLEIMAGGAEQQIAVAFFATEDDRVLATAEDRPQALVLADNEFTELSALVRAVRGAPDTNTDDNEQQSAGTGELTPDQ